MMDRLFWTWLNVTVSLFCLQDAFIGYGGNVIREKVKNGAHWFVTDFQELIEGLS